MNFLAHFHLAWPDEGLVAGGLEGDYFKGPLKGDLPDQLEQGVQLHRAIDAYTDRHPAVTALRREFPADLRRYAGILIDLCFDHYLSRHWDNFSDTPLPEFTGNIYGILSRHEHAMSNAARRMLARMVEFDILGLYGDWDTVPKSAERVGQRFRRHNPLTDVDRGLAPVRESMEKAFLVFYPDLLAFSENWKRQ